MNRLLLLLFFIGCFSISEAQKTVTVDGQPLQIEIEGELDLLWAVSGRNYRFFVRTADGNVTELKSSKGSDGKFRKEFRETLKTLTPKADVKTDNVSLTIGSLRRFVNGYNKTVDPNFNDISKNKKVNFRLAFFGGITNHPLVENIENNSNA